MKRWIPFHWLPSSWGLRGEAFEIAAANYYLEGEDLDRALLSIRYRDDKTALKRVTIEMDHRCGHIDTYRYETLLAELDAADDTDLRRRRLEIDLFHDKITPYDAARSKIMLSEPGVARDLELLDTEFKFKRISKIEYEKQRAVLRDEPWIAIINSGFDPEKGIDGVFFEFDWNTKWIDFLRSHGYVGQADEQIVDQWFANVCQSHSAAELAGSLAPSHNLHR